MGFFDNLFGNGREIKKLQKIVEQINGMEDKFTSLTDKELRGKTEEYKARYQGGEDLDSLLPEAFATMREASRRVLGLRHYDVQLIGGMVLHQGRIAEMRTGATNSY